MVGKICPSIRKWRSRYGSLQILLGQSHRLPGQPQFFLHKCQHQAQFAAAPDQKSLLKVVRETVSQAGSDDEEVEKTVSLLNMEMIVMAKTSYSRQQLYNVTEVSNNRTHVTVFLNIVYQGSHSSTFPFWIKFPSFAWIQGISSTCELMRLKPFAMVVRVSCHVWMILDLQHLDGGKCGGACPLQGVNHEWC